MTSIMIPTSEESSMVIDDKKMNGQVAAVAIIDHHQHDDSGKKQQLQYQPQPQQRNLYYFSDEAAHNLPKFQYRGKDNSILYNYILSPLANFCVEYLTPTWLAPNAITLIGLVLMTTAYGAGWYYVPTLEMVDSSEPPPRWIFLWNGIAMLIYQTLDNMDGKQARKTKSSSPLGLLFDHGIDALNSVFGSANWMLAMMLHPKRDAFMCFSILFGPYTLFFISTWEEYYTGELVLPIFNGPNEGLLGGAVMSFVSFWYGPSFWQQNVTAWNSYILPFLQTILPSFWTEALLPNNLRYADLLVLTGCFLFHEIAFKVIYIVRTYGLSTIPKLLPFATLVLCSAVVGYTDVDIWLSMPRTSLHLCAALFVEMTTALMTAHVTHQPYLLRERWLILPLVVFAAGVWTGWMPRSLTDDYLLSYASFAIGHLSLKVSIIIHEACTVLNVWCFDITTPRKIATVPRIHTTSNAHHKKEH